LYCLAKRYPERHLAGRFAAKEAFFKALGSGAMTPGEFALVEVINDPLGNPGFNVLGNVADRIAGLKILKIHLSLTHTVSTAAAVVILEA
jgi:holo-[acyl-carrier protein] synthase